MELKKNDKIHLTIGSQVTIIKELGRGGQGIVYLVELSGKKMALKWYHNSPGDDFYNNLENNVQAKAPSDAFIWPEYITKKEKGSYGYVMRLRPNDYYEFGNYLLAKKKFKSFEAMMNAAMKICEGFMMLHRYGYSYQDLNDGNFFIRDSDGDVLICDNDNIMPQGDSSGILGKARYMAPEIMAGKRPDKYSDRFSLSVILFMLLFCNHPFEGAKVAACPCMTEDYEKRFYGSEAVFIYDKKDKSNSPVRGVHKNVIKRWPLFPSILKETFIEQFSKEKLNNPTTRLLEQKWQSIISQVRDEIVVCPNCHKDTILDLSKGITNCLNCEKKIETNKFLRIGNRNLILTPGTKLYIDNDNLPDGKVEAYNNDNSILVIKNLTGSNWRIETPSGKVKELGPNEIMPVKAGLKISFGSSIPGALGAKGEIFINN